MMTTPDSSYSDERSLAWRRIGVFLLVLAVFSTGFHLVFALGGGMGRYTVAGIMWTPTLAAIITLTLFGGSLRQLPWAWGPWRWPLFAWLLPAGYGLVMYLPVWWLALGGTGFPNPETTGAWSASIIGEGDPQTWAVVIYILLLATVGVAQSAANAAGEEIGWRGFLIWEMRKVMPFWALGLLSGLIWALWHVPAILFSDYNAGAGNFSFQMLMFILGIVPEGLIYAYFTFRSNSLWPAVILHASHNMFLQRVYTPLTLQGENSHFYIDEFGIMLPIVSVTLGAYFCWRAYREGIA